MKIEYDREVDALYIRIQEKYVAKTQEIAEGKIRVSLWPAAAPAGLSGSPENEEGFFVSSRGSAMREKGALNEAARRRAVTDASYGD